MRVRIGKNRRYWLTTILVMGIYMWATFPSHAQIPLTPAPVPNTPFSHGAVTPNAVQDIPAFHSAGQWRVETLATSQTRGMQAINLPCLLVNQFDNGFHVRLSGGGGSMLAMAIDFRQNIFRKGRRYNAALTIGMTSQVLHATAFTSNILLFNVRKVPQFYSSLAQGLPMAIDVEGNKMLFTMDNIQEGLTRLEECFGPSRSPLVSPVPVSLPPNNMVPPEPEPVIHQRRTGAPARLSAKTKEMDLTIIQVDGM